MRTLRISILRSTFGWYRPVGDEVRLVNAEDRDDFAPDREERPPVFGVMYPGSEDRPLLGVLADPARPLFGVTVPGV